MIFESTDLDLVKSKLKADNFKWLRNNRSRNYYVCKRHVDCQCKRVRDLTVNDQLTHVYQVREYGQHSEQIVEALDIKEFGLSIAKTVPHLTVVQTELLILRETVQAKGLSSDKVMQLMPTTKQIDNQKQHLKRCGPSLEVNSSRSLQVSVNDYLLLL